MSAQPRSQQSSPRRFRCQYCMTYVGSKMLRADKYDGHCPICGTEIEVSS